MILIQVVRFIKCTLTNLFVCLMVSSFTFAQDASDIWVGKLHLGQKTPITDLVRITDTASYTNQPYFFSDSQLLYTQAMPKQGDEPDSSEKASLGEDEQTEIMRFNLLSGELSNLTQSDSSEYSATPLPNKPGFSVIRVNKEGLQELWQMDVFGKAVQHLVPIAEPVGYQVWLNNSELLLFILGEPHTLQRVDTKYPEVAGSIIDTDIGASLFRLKSSDWFLYTSTKTHNFLYGYNVKTNKTRELVRMPLGAEYFSLSPNGDLLTSDGEKLWHIKVLVNEQGLIVDGKFTHLKIKHEHCDKGVSRTAVSQDMSMIALVCPRKT